MVKTGDNRAMDTESFIAVGDEIGQWVTILEALQSPHVVRTRQVEAAFEFARKNIILLQNRMQDIWESAETKAH